MDMKEFKRNADAGWEEVRYFHPEGRSMPNGSHYQRGGFINECRQNANSFVLNGRPHNDQCEKRGCRGGIIVFCCGMEAAEANVSRIMEMVMSGLNAMGDGDYSVGNFFKGKYVSGNGSIYNERSIAVDVNGLSSEALLGVAEMAARELKQENVLVKDLNKEKILVADSIPVSTLREIER